MRILRGGADFVSESLFGTEGQKQEPSMSRIIGYLY